MACLVPMKPAHSTPTTKDTLTRIGRFRIIRELGRGTIGCVYLAHDPVIDREVAIKTFLPTMSAPERKRYEDQFINEARASGRLNHTNIVTIYEASNENHATYIAMEYLQGTELHKMLSAKQHFATGDIATIIYKLASALEYAHKNNVIHRDIKPPNIFLIGDNQPKLMDFGIARAPNRVADEFAGTNDAPFTLYCKENLLGTPNYMSPEQAQCNQVDHRTDIYSLGAVMYEMLCGHRAFVAPDMDQLLEKIAHRAPKAPHEIDPEVPMGLSEIVMRAMSKRPEKRYQSAGEMALELKKFILTGKRMRQEDRRKQARDGSDRRSVQMVDAPPAGFLGKLFKGPRRAS